jgi:hypothetical protein
MSKNLVVGDEVYEYPDTGDINYGEEATNWAESITEIVQEIRGPGDIPITGISLIGASSGGFVTGDITKLTFDTAYVQRIEVTGFVTRTFSDATPTKVEGFVIEGAFNGSEINYTVEYSGEETELEITVSGGQFGFKYKEIDHTDQVSIKFRGKAQVNESYFE